MFFKSWHAAHFYIVFTFTKALAARHGVVACWGWDEEHKHTRGYTVVYTPEKPKIRSF